MKLDRYINSFLDSEIQNFLPKLAPSLFHDQSGYAHWHRLGMIFSIFLDFWVEKWAEKSHEGSISVNFSLETPLARVVIFHHLVSTEFRIFPCKLIKIWSLTNKKKFIKILNLSWRKNEPKLALLLTEAKNWKFFTR